MQPIVILVAVVLSESITYIKTDGLKKLQEMMLINSTINISHKKDYRLMKVVENCDH